MSAVVGILNKQAIAIAADSAVTVNGKIYNHALKIFTLSKIHPVGIMIYSSGTFMSTPWETIIKIYRSELGETSFDDIQGYSANFVQFLHDKNFFVDNNFQKKHFKLNFLYSLFRAIYDQGKKITSIALPLPQAVDQYCDELVVGWGNNTSMCVEFQDYTVENFNEFLGDEFENTFAELFTNNGILVTDETKEKIRTIAHLIICKEEQFSNYTGLVFVGFGDRQIFPSLIALNVHFAIQNRLKHYQTNFSEINHEMGSSIRPFAQTEAMNTILVGVAPNLENIYKENFKQYIEKYNARLIALIQPQNAELAAAIEAIDIQEQADEFSDKLQEAKETNYISPLMDAVASLSKEDLAEMAESLIYLTYLQKRITFAAEDVGGAVDVAVISKGDGFIWIKQKHYFNPNLNKSFFTNYFKR